MRTKNVIIIICCLLVISVLTIVFSINYFATKKLNSYTNQEPDKATATNITTLSPTASPTATALSTKSPEFTDKTLIELDKLVTKDTAEISPVNSAYKSISIVLDNDSTITKAAKDIDIPKEFIQSILLKELSTQDALDSLADSMVESYYKQMESKGSCDGKSDSSTGLGQIFASTAISSHNNLVNHGIIDDSILSKSDWKVKQDIWTKLKDDDSFNIKYVSYTLKSNAINLGLSKLSDCSDEQVAKLFASYNGSGDAAKKYGKIAQKYNTLFKTYNN